MTPKCDNFARYLISIVMTIQIAVSILKIQVICSFETLA